MDDQRTDIKAASSHQGGSRLISEADLASIGGGGHSEPRQPVLDSQSDRTKTYSPSSKSEGSSLAAFFGLLMFTAAKENAAQTAANAPNKNFFIRFFPITYLIESVRKSTEWFYSTL